MERKQRRFDLVWIQIDSGIEERLRQLLKFFRRESSRELVGIVIRVEDSAHNELFLFVHHTFRRRLLYPNIPQTSDEICVLFGSS